jgi:hypothetical protein
MPLRPPALLTAGDGQFAFRGLGRGSFSISAAKPGFLPGGYGMQRPNGTPQTIALAQGEQKSEILVRLFKTATIGGTVLDDLGEPLVGARVVAGRRIAASLGPESVFQYVGTTDDRGVYRIGNLAPGEYTVGVVITQASMPAVGAAGPTSGTFVSADRRFVLAAAGSLAAVQDGAGRLLSYASTFYPSARTSAQATPVALRPGDERLGIDLSVPLLPAATVSGRISSPDGQVAGYLMRLTATEIGGVPAGLPTAQTASDADGSFVFLGVPSGRYVLQTERTPRPAAGPTGSAGAQTAGQTYWALMPVSVGETDITGLSVVTQPAMMVAGRIELEGDVLAPGARTTVSLAFDALDGTSRASRISGVQGAITPFSLIAVMPGRYRVTIIPSAGWHVKSATSGGADITDGPFEIGDRDVSDLVIKLTDRPSTIAGTVRVSGKSDPDAVVLAFPSDTKYWPIAGAVSRRFASVRASPQGTFGPVSLRPGDYYAVAIGDEPADEWREVRFLEVLARSATRVTLGEGETLNIDLTRATIREGGTSWGTEELGNWGSGSRLLAFVARQVRDTRTAAPRDPGSVSGVVLAADGSNRPVPRARISLRPLEGRQDFATISDPRGRFVFARVPAGRYTMSVGKSAYLTAHYGTGEGVLPPGLPISVEEGKAVTDLTLRLVRGGVITGTVFDERGQPSSGARITVLQPFGDDRRLSPIVIQGTPTTDDRGIYRIFGLQPGSYAVAAQPSVGPIPNFTGELRYGATSGRPVAYAGTYYPGTVMSSEASLVSVAAGRDTAGVDISTRLVAASRLEGTVSSADGQPVPYVQVQIVPRAPSQLQASRSASGHAPADGMTSIFYVTDLVPGQYTVIARAVDQKAPARAAGVNSILWGQQDVDVMGEDVVGVSLVLQPAMTLTGRVVFEGTTAEAVSDSRTLRIVLNSTGSAVLAGVPPSTAVGESGRFTIPNIVPGRYTFAASALSLVGGSPPGIWTLASAMAGERDLVDYPLDVRAGQPIPDVVVTYSNQTAELSGRLLDAAGQPMRGMWILLFGTDRAVWSPGSRRVKAPIRPAEDGSFRFMSLPPGEYFLGVMTDVDPKQVGDPTLLEQLAPAAIRVTIGPGEKKTQDIRIAGRPHAVVRAGSSARR